MRKLSIPDCKRWVKKCVFYYWKKMKLNKYLNTRGEQVQEPVVIWNVSVWDQMVLVFNMNIIIFSKICSKVDRLIGSTTSHRAVSWEHRVQAVLQYPQLICSSHTHACPLKNISSRNQSIVVLVEVTECCRLYQDFFICSLQMIHSCLGQCRQHTWRKRRICPHPM